MYTDLQLLFATPEAIQLFGTFISLLLIGSSSSLLCTEKHISCCYLLFNKTLLLVFGILMVFDTNLVVLKAAF